MAGITSKTSNWLIDGVMRPSGTLGDVTFNDSYAFKNLSLVNTSDRTDAVTGKLLSHCIERFTNQGHGLIDDFTCWNPQGHRDEHEYKVLDRISSE